MDWQYESATDLELSLTERLRNFPREPDMLVFGLRSLAAILIRLWLRLVHRLRITGDSLPAESCILVANHSSHLDAVVLQAVVPLHRLHRVFPAAAEDYFFRSLHRMLFATIFVNALPFARSTHIRQSLSLCRALLETPGNILILFPEGSRSVDGRMDAFRPGIGALVAGTSIPVVPCWIEGAARAWPKGKRLPRPRQVSLRVGTPLRFAEAVEEKDEFQRIAQTIQEAVEGLSHAAC